VKLLHEEVEEGDEDDDDNDDDEADDDENDDDAANKCEEADWLLCRLPLRPLDPRRRVCKEELRRKSAEGTD
jgi:hypothetical protein